MKVQLEVFFTKLQNQEIHYFREELDISGKSDNPDMYVDEMVEKISERYRVDRDRCIIHSTSWRCAQCDLISLTYIVYSDFLDFGDKPTKVIPVAELSLAEGTINAPHPTHLEEKHIVSHALRHVSMLMKKNPQTYKPALKPESFTAFQNIAIALAGKI